MGDRYHLWSSRGWRFRDKGVPRIARVAVEGLPHHVTQRGNYRQVVFEDDADRARYLEYLCQYKWRYGLKVWAWCLMHNHVHLIVVPESAESISKTLHMTHMRYANYANRKRGCQGHLWQGRFYSCVLEGEHIGMAVRYVERNPVRARMARNGEDYRWSSARGHVTGKPDGVSDDLPKEDMLAGVRGGWSKWLAMPEQCEGLEMLRKSTRTGRPFGSVGFIARVEAILGRRVRSLGLGRPKKAAE